MGFRFRKSVNAGPFRLNLGKRGVGYSIGVPGCRVSTSADGRRYLVLSVPGTGISWWKQLRPKSKSPVGQNQATTTPQMFARSGRGTPPGSQVEDPNISPNSSKVKVRPRIKLK